MQGGSLRNWIVIERPVPVQDETGQAKIQWQRVCGCWASFSNVAGIELPAGQMPESRVSWRLMIRYRRGIDHTMRVRYAGTRLMNIAAVFNVDELNEQLALNVSEGIGHG